MKLPVNKAKLSGFWARNCATFQQVWSLKFAFGPVKLLSLLRNRPLYIWRQASSACPRRHEIWFTFVDNTFSQIHEYDIEKFTRHLNSRDPPCTFSFTRKWNPMESYPSWILAFSSKSVIKDDSYKPWMCRNPLNTVKTSGTKSKVISTNSITLSYVCGVSEKPLIKDLTPTTSLSTTGNIWLTPKIHHQGKKCWLTNKIQCLGCDDFLHWGDSYTFWRNTWTV